MAKEKAKFYPMLPVTHWWTLRDKFKQSIPGVVTDNYLATALNTQTRSAHNNVVPYLKDMGLIDNEGRTLDLAKAWRDDEQYPEVCAKMRENIYPEDLITAIPNPTEDRAAVERWFANQTGAGTAAVKRMAAIYIVISEADAHKKPQKNGRKKIKTVKKKDSVNSDKVKLASHPPKSTMSQAPLPGPPPAAPGLNINIEIHISSDATPDQIDKIFESMARHIYKR